MAVEKTGIVEREETAFAKHRFDKHASAATDTPATIEELSEAAFSMRSVPMLQN
jgi:hypothetical protein